MPKAWWITGYRQIKDPDKVAAHAKLAGPTLAPFDSVVASAIPAHAVTNQK